MKWVTREKPKIDRIACPWLIRRFVDTAAEFLYVPYDLVLQTASDLNAIPFDFPGVEYTHYGELCTFDYILTKHHLGDPALHMMAPIVRGADTDRYGLAEQSAGLWAISAGLAYNHPDDHDLLRFGMVLYDGLYSWAKHLPDEKHTQQPFEHLLLGVFHKFIRRQKGNGQKIPAWALEMKNIIQDQIDTNLTLSLKEISRELDVNPSYLSREFSKYFDNLKFGEYIRKMRIEKAKHYIQATGYSLTEIAYLTGFSDQSHFTRIFRQHTGQSPSAYKKSLAKK